VKAGWNARRFGELDALLRRALDLEGDARAGFLRALAGTRPDLAAALRGMLAAADAGGDDALSAALDADVWAALADDPATGQRFGAWRALATLAHGGMARVLLAERADGAFQQRAAIKCLWSGLATPELVARFEQERQILARLDDPRIARLLDGGVRADGVPWLALEYVDGEPIDAHCDTRRLPLDARVSLWLDVVGAVAAAHRQLIVHRDLKPANVLVGDGDAVKLLDFGIAKLLDAQDFPHAAPATRLGGHALTQAYASPEQRRGDPVTTASDVYQLGLLLYELSTGVPLLRGAQPHRLPALEDDPPPPSGAAMRGADAAARADRRATHAVRLARRLRGDLDAIVLRALAKDPVARYVSADALGEDVLRWRRGLPVSARRIGALRRAGKWLRRNALPAAAAAAILLSSGLYAASALRQARALAREASVNRATRNYLVGWFQTADPGSGAGDPRASEMLAGALSQAQRELREQPELQAEVLAALGEVHVARGEYDLAEPILREAYALARSLPDAGLPQRTGAATRLATLLHYSGRYAQSQALFAEALADDDGNSGDSRILLARQHYGDLLHSRGRYAAAIGQLERARADARAAFGADAPLGAAIARHLGDVYRDSGRYREAEALYLDTLRVQRAAHGPMHVNTLATGQSYGRLLLDLGRIDEAAAEIEPAFEAYRRLIGTTAPGTTYWERSVAGLEEARGELDAARARLRRIDETQRARLSPGNLGFGYVALDAGYVDLARGDAGAARGAFERAMQVLDGVQPEGHPRRADALLGLALLARLDGDAGRASALLDRAQAEAERALAPQHALFAAITQARGDAQRTSAPSLAQLRVQRALARIDDNAGRPAPSAVEAR
jgi:serine/threonine-protein kinase